jgi:polar amino acid transport system substrate-binding protein
MTGHPVSLRTKTLTVTMVSLAIALAGCASTSGASDPASNPASTDLTALPGIKSVASLASQVPQDVKSSGITVATSPNNPPMTYVAEDNHTLVGFDLDMAHAIGKVLDVETESQEASLDSIIPGLAANRYTMAMSSLGVTAERQKTVDFVSYYQGGQGFLATKKSDFKVEKLEDLCGKRVAVGAGSVQQTTLADSAGICKAAGLEDYVVQPYPDNNQSVLAITSDRVDVMYASISIVGYSAKQNENLRVAGVYKRATVGIALPKNSPMTPVAQAAVQHLIDDGTYAQILKKWGLEDNALTKAEINSAK